MPSLLANDYLGGEIDEGVTKEGNIIWYLKKDGTAKDITWIKLSWNTRKGKATNFNAQYNLGYNIDSYITVYP